MPNLVPDYQKAPKPKNEEFRRHPGSYILCVIIGCVGFLLIPVAVASVSAEISNDTARVALGLVGEGVWIAPAIIIALRYRWRAFIQGIIVGLAIILVPLFTCGSPIGLMYVFNLLFH